MTRLYLVLPAYNEEKGLETSMKRLEKGLSQMPGISAHYYLVDDCSTDSTFDAMNAFASKNSNNFTVVRNPQNLGLVATLKQSYNNVLEGGHADYILKTDLDSDFDQEKVITSMVPFISQNAEVVAGIRWRPIEEDENPYEFQRRQEVVSVLEKELGISRLDPPSSGSQLYKANALSDIMQQPMIIDYDRKWGLDFLIPLVAKSLGHEVDIVNIENGKYDPSRRPHDKVKAQYDAYLETIARFSGKAPEQLSRFYGLKE